MCWGLHATVMTAEETVLREAPVPNRMLRQGTAVHFRDGSEEGVRIAFHTRHLPRIEEKILESERTNWPEHPDSLRYREALSDACRKALETGSGRVGFTIEWRTGPEGGGRVTLSWTGGELVLKDLDPDYVSKNLTLILEDRFGITPQQETL
jgi:hypothetical protein